MQFFVYAILILETKVCRWRFRALRILLMDWHLLDAAVGETSS